MPIADRYDCFLFDLDGVLFRGERPVEGAAGTLDRLRDAGKCLTFVTNNSARTPEEVAAKLSGLGIAADPREVETSARATAELLSERRVRSAYVIGERGIREALADAGIRVVDGDPDAVDVVVVGWDRGVDYDKLRTASLLVQRGAALVATNADASYPAPDGRWPGAGAILAAVVTTTGATAEIVGKPNTPLFSSAAVRAGGDRPLVVGDRLETDIAGAAALGWDSLLVLSGIATLGDLSSSALHPTFVGSDVRALLDDDLLESP